MELLLDTHIFLWWDRDLAKLSPDTQSKIRDPETIVWVSSISIFELAMKRASNHLIFEQTIEALVHHHRFQVLDVTARHAEEAAALPMYHRDPFDRLLIAQARVEQLTLVTDDAKMRQYSVTIL